MRLINARTLRLEQFFAKVPPYAILSHTWGVREVDFQHFHRLDERERFQGYPKIKALCDVALRQGLEYAWADTCCIDKTSSSELQEAINSMFKWYQKAAVCFAYLEDVEVDHRRQLGKALRAGEVGFAQSRWFTRGWTLQELIAPAQVQFYNRHWVKIGEKAAMADELQAITGVDGFVLKGGPVKHVNVGRRMSWAVDRQTTREEDLAYSLLGLFNVNMPLLYGEGDKAFLRLQEQILRQSDDQTLFAWRSTSPPAANSSSAQSVGGLLAPSPNAFRNFLTARYGTAPDKFWTGVGGRIGLPRAKDDLVRVWDQRQLQEPITLTNKGVKITSRVVDLHASWASRDYIVLILNCCPGGDPSRATGIYLRRQDEDRYARVRTSELADVTLTGGIEYPTMTIYGLRSALDVRGHHYDEPWTTSYKVRNEIADEEAEVEEAVLSRPPSSPPSSPGRPAVAAAVAAETTRHRYEHAFYMRGKCFENSTLFGRYSLCAVFVADPQRGMLRLFRFEPRHNRLDLVLKTHAGFRGALLMRSADGADFVLILLGIRGEAAAADGGREHWLDAMCLDGERFKRDPGALARLILAAEDGRPEATNHPPQSSSLSFSTTRSPPPEPQHRDFITVRLSDKELILRVRASAVEVEGLPMLAVEISGPWPVSWLRLELRVLLYLAAYAVVAVVAAVLWYWVARVLTAESATGGAMSWPPASPGAKLPDDYLPPT